MVEKKEEHVQANNGPLIHKPLHRKYYWYNKIG